jgi:hypothetical protein
MSLAREADGRTIVTFGMKIPAGIFIPTMVVFLR